MKNYIYHGTRNLIALPGRAVTTFPSGLVRVDRTYASRTVDAERYRRDLAVGSFVPDRQNSPAIDWELIIGQNTYFEPSLKIFPEVPERRRDDGFTEYTVSAYGQINSEGSIRRGLSLERYTKNFSQNAGGGDPGFQWTITEFWEIETVTILKTIRSSDSLESFTQPPGPFFKKLRNRRITGNRPPDGDSTLNLIFSVALLSAQRTNFGHIDEVALTWGNEAFV
jgi:hypothetical protein